MENTTIKNLIRTILNIFIITVSLLIVAGTLYVGFMVFYYFYSQPSRNSFDKKVLWEYWWEKDKNGECIIDLDDIMHVKWDSAIHYTAKYEFKEICDDLGFQLKEYQDIGDRIIFMRDGNVVFYSEWFPYPSDTGPDRSIICYDGDKLVIYPGNAKFKAYKQEGYRELFMEKIEKNEN